jgi:TRAP-type C4-dicarboxylate transport system substrate-binding protein
MVLGFARCFVGIAAALAVAAVVPIAAQSRLNIRLATLAPENSPWATALRSMGAAWQKATANRVRLTVFAGTIPSESSAVARLAVDGLQAATLTAAGLSEIDEAFNVFGVPFFFQTDEELAYVQEQLEPMLAARLEAKKFRLIGWGNAGWVQLFSKQPIRGLADLRKAKLYTGEGSPKMVQWYTSNGFHVVPLAAGEIPKQLKLPTGAIDAAPSPPVLALTLQFFRDAPYMLDIRVAPLTSATIMTESAWNRVSAEDRPRLLEAAQVAEARIRADAPGLDAKAIKEMQDAGLQVIRPDEASLRGFVAAAEILLATQRGNMVPADVYDAAVKARGEFRAANK